MRWSWLLLSLVWSAAVWAIGENCSQIWTQAIRSSSTVPAWGYCFGNNPSCYNVTDATTISSLPATLAAGDYFLTGSIPSDTTFNTSGATVRIFVKGSLSIGDNVQLNWNGPAQNLLLVVSGSLSIGSNVKIRGFILAGGAVSIANGTSGTLDGGVTSNGAFSGAGNLTAAFNSNALLKLQGGVVCGGSLSCLNDNFQAATLSSNWVTTRTNGNFTPSNVNGRLRITESTGNQATAASFQRLFPARSNLVVVEFDHFAYGRTSSEGGDGIAVVLSDASVTPVSGALGGPLGYGARSNVNGFAGGWLGIGIDEYGNFSAEGGSNGPGRRRQSVAIRGSGSGTAGYRYLAGTCNNGTTRTNTSCLSPQVDNNNVSPPHRYRVTVDSQIANQSLVKIERNSGNGFVTLISSFNAAAATGQAALPANFLLSLTGGTGGANNHHEIDDLEICALRSDPVLAQIDHFEFSYSGQALTCKAETFTIKACQNAACTQLVTGNVSATLVPATGWIAGTGLTGNTINFSGGTATATLSQTTPATIRVGTSGSNPSTRPFSTTLCQIGASITAANCDVVFSSSGLVFSVSDKIAGKPATGILVKAVKSNGSQQCVPSFANVNRTVRFWSEFNNPVTPSASPGRAVSVSNGGTYTNIGKTSGTATALALSFNGSGEASIGVNYSDAGQVTLKASYSGSVATNDANLSMTGADQFVSAPAGLCITPQQYCAAGNATCTGYFKAGDTFPLAIKAVGWESDVDSNFCNNTTTTPSFQLDGISLSSFLVQPSGGDSGSLTPSSYNHSAASTATTTVNPSQSEVGVFNLAASYNGPYIGMPVNLTSTMTSPLGRIVPHRFSMMSFDLDPSCDAVSYFEQPALLSFTIQAQNASGGRVLNYRGTFAKATAALVAENNNDGVERSSRLNNQSNLLSWDNGEAQLINSPVYVKRDTAPDGPFSQLRIGLKLNDNDDLDAKLQALDQRVDSSANCSVAGDCDSKMLTTSNMDWRYGRLQIVNALGSEQSNLPVQLKAEYWNGSQFVPNSLDSCTATTPSKLLITTGTNPVITASGNPTKLNQGSSGAFDLMLSPPGVESRYPLLYQLDDQPWLQYDWTPGDGVLLEDPKGEAVFGGFRGNNRQIFWQEN